MESASSGTSLHCRVASKCSMNLYSVGAYYSSAYVAEDWLPPKLAIDLRHLLAIQRDIRTLLFFYMSILFYILI